MAGTDEDILLINVAGLVKAVKDEQKDSLFYSSGCRDNHAGVVGKGATGVSKHAGPAGSGPGIADGIKVKRPAQVFSLPMPSVSRKQDVSVSREFA